MNNYATIQNQKGTFSLIKYEPPIDITLKLDAYEKSKLIERSDQSKPSSEDILNIILPPRQWKNTKGQYFLQYVSHDRLEREEVEKIQQQLQKQLVEMQAKTKGICPVREYLFGQVFDEIIRQVTIDCAERGLILLRVRDQQKMTIAAYQTIYQEAMAYGIKKQIQSEEGMDDLQAQLHAIQQQKKRLQLKKIELLSKKSSIEQKKRQTVTVERQKREYQLKAIKTQNQYLSSFVEQKRVRKPQVQPVGKQRQDQN